MFELGECHCQTPRVLIMNIHELYLDPTSQVFPGDMFFGFSESSHFMTGPLFAPKRDLLWLGVLG